MTQVQSQTNRQQIQTQDPVALLDQILAKSSESTKTKLINDSLLKRIEAIRELLPDHLSNQAERFVKRAALYFSQRTDLQACAPASFITCVLQGAELGLAIDGFLAHAVPYNRKIKDANGRDAWIKEAKFIADYKGIVAVCRRNKIILDCYARIVCRNDEFDAWEEDGACRLIHRIRFGQARGEVTGAYAKVILPGGLWRYEWMDIGEIDQIKARSKAKDKGPWHTDENEMRKKVALKRCLKTYMDDPDINRLLAVDGDFDNGEIDNVQREKPSIEEVLKARDVPAPHTAGASFLSADQLLEKLESLEDEESIKAFIGWVEHHHVKGVLSQEQSVELIELANDKLEKAGVNQ